jgi:hypothetical protein
VVSFAPLPLYSGGNGSPYALDRRLDAVKRTILLLPGIEPQPFSPQPVAIPTVLPPSIYHRILKYRRYDINMEVKEIKFESMYLVEDRVQWNAVNSRMNLPLVQRTMNFLTSWATISFLKTLFHGDKRYLAF